MATTVARSIERVLGWTYIRNPDQRGLRDALHDELMGSVGIVVDQIGNVSDAYEVRRNGGVVLEVIDEEYPDIALNGDFPVDGIFICPITIGRLDEKVLKAWGESQYSSGQRSESNSSETSSQKA